MDRPGFIRQITVGFEIHPVVALMGPRQCDKTTLARMFAETATGPLAPVARFDLEAPTDLAALAQPKLALQDLQGLVVIDEIERRPELWHANVGRRQVKAPKLYLRDSGLFHVLMGIGDRAALSRHPKLGPSWEGFAIEQIVRLHAASSDEAYFWAAHGGAEVDLLMVRGDAPVGYVVKYTDHPRATRSMHTAIETLGLNELQVVYPGDKSFPLGNGIRAIGIGNTLASLAN